MIRRWILRLTLGPLLLLIAHMLTFRQVPVPLTPLMIIRLFQGEGLEQEWVSLDEMSPHLARSVIGSEDNRFCTHEGVDWSADQSTPSWVQNRLSSLPMTERARCGLISSSDTHSCSSPSPWNRRIIISGVSGTGTCRKVSMCAMSSRSGPSVSRRIHRRIKTVASA